MEKELKEINDKLDNVSSKLKYMTILLNGIYLVVALTAVLIFVLKCVIIK